MWYDQKIQNKYSMDLVVTWTSYLNTVLACVTTMNTPYAACRIYTGSCGMLHLRSSEDADGGDSVEAVAAHQVGDVVLDLHLLTGVTGSLKQLSSGRVVVLETTEMYRKKLLVSECWWGNKLIRCCDYWPSGTGEPQMQFMFYLYF